MQRRGVAVLLSLVVLAYAGRTIIRNRDFKDWITFYEKAVQLNPQSAYLKNDLAILLSRAGAYEDSGDYFSRALAIQPDNAHFHFSAAEMYAASGQDQKAVEALEQAIRYQPDFPEAYFNLAGAMAFQGKRDQALSHLETAVKLWKKQGRILEAGEAMSAFFVFIAQQEESLPNDAAQEFLKFYVQD